MSRWTLEVKTDPENGDQILEFPDDLMVSAGWKEGDVLEWINNGDGSWTLRKQGGVDGNQRIQTTDSEY